jgi:hypothetical protein
MKNLKINENRRCKMLHLIGIPENTLNAVSGNKRAAELDKFLTHDLVTLA